MYFYKHINEVGTLVALETRSAPIYGLLPLGVYEIDADEYLELLEEMESADDL